MTFKKKKQAEGKINASQSNFACSVCVKCVRKFRQESDVNYLTTLRGQNTKQRSDSKLLYFVFYAEDVEMI
jgi:hypothetical protein